MGGRQSQLAQEMTAPLLQQIEQLKASLAENELNLIQTKKHNKNLEAELECKTCENCIKLEVEFDQKLRDYEEQEAELQKIVDGKAAELEAMKEKAEEEQVSYMKLKDKPSDEENRLIERLSEVEFEIAIARSSDAPETPQGDMTQEELEVYVAEVRAKRERAEEENFRQISEMFELGSKHEAAKIALQELKSKLESAKSELAVMQQSMEKFFS